MAQTISPSVRVVISPGCPEYAVLLLSQALGGAVAVPSDPQTSVLGWQEAESPVVILDGRPGGSRSGWPGGLTIARRWRCDKNCRFRGPILLLGFHPRDWFLSLPDAGILNTPGCDYLQIPFLLSGVRDRLARASVLSDAEWNAVRQKLAVRDAALMAARIRHRADSVFSVALSALFDLEKLSYFQDPDPERVRRLAATVTESLTRERLMEFENTIIELLGEAHDISEGGYSDSVAAVRASMKAVQEYAAQLAPSETRSPEELRPLLERARVPGDALRSVLGLVTRVHAEMSQGQCGSQ